MTVDVATISERLPTAAVVIGQLNWRRRRSLACCSKPGLDDKKQVCRVKCDRLAVLSPESVAARLGDNPRLCRDDRRALRACAWRLSHGVGRGQALKKGDLLSVIGNLDLSPSHAYAGGGDQLEVSDFSERRISGQTIKSSAKCRRRGDAKL